ncbi:hypothetical protein Athai_07870 [Actinocatenispora thailandica]|uniref:Uncharacterized protein n=1 Tax=Actinocatenispora thailandica TaxID=227318 RepID=A0A7R7DKA3_9ACTN|nr:hypothetical protein [Actinocatenispora thailandica]BCJ33284.1 hypothetical protein Athai_07870 [Actinocatenispora thailandica]
MPERPALARTPAEARLRLELTECPVCFERETRWRLVSTATVAGTALERYAGSCGRCGAEREADFRAPGDASTDAGGTEPATRFGAGRPSELLDAAEWLEAATLTEAAADAGPAEPAAERRARLEYARDAVVEAMRFLPPDGDRVPEADLFSPLGRQVAAADARRLTRDWMRTMRDGYEVLLAEIDDRR